MTAPTALPTTRRTGRFSQEEIEERTEIGRLVHRIEDHQAGAGAELAYLRVNLRELFPLHDAGCDAQVRDIEAFARCLTASTDPAAQRIGREILARCAMYWVHDQAEDGSVDDGARHGEAAHVEVRAIGGACEMAASGRQRGRLRRGLVRATQPSLLEGMQP